MSRRRARTRERIFTEAMRLFAERGFDAVTVADITEAADIGKGTFFTHFPSKRDVFRYLGEQVVRVVLDADVGDGTAEERLRRMLDAAADWLEAHPEPARQMVKARSFNLSLDLGSENQKRFHAAVVDILTAGRSSGELRDDVPLEAAALAVQCGYYACMLMWATHPDGEPLRDRLATSLDILLNGLK